MKVRAYPAEPVPGAAGMGLRARADLPAGEAVAVFDGPVLPFAQLPEEELSYALLLDGDRWLVPQGPARWINHGCDPNCRVDDELLVRTRRPVAEGEELTIDYNRVSEAEWARDAATLFWHPRWTFDCRCGAANCQGRVNGYRVLREEPPLALGAGVEVRRVPGKGRGVYARRGFAPGAEIERCPVLVLPDYQWRHVEATELYNYCFGWGEELEHTAIALGFGSLYNHSYRPSAVYRRDLEEGVIIFDALEEIPAGHEITVNYNNHPDDPQPVWFNVVE